MRFIFLFFILSNFNSFGQHDVANRNHFKNFFNSNKQKNLLVIGENHGSSTSALFYPSLIKYLNKKTGMRNLLIEFGPAEAYFYSKYLETGDEKHLNYTIYAGAIQEWRDAWRQIYQYNKTLKKPLNVIGIDFDRTRTMAYALFSIFKKYEKKPAFIEPLLAEISSDSFYKTYTIGYPSKKDIQWVTTTKKLLNENIAILQEILDSNSLKTVNYILKNEAVNYSDARDKAIANNTQRLINDSEEEDFLLLIGRNHAYFNPLFPEKFDRLSKLIVQKTSIKIMTGVILYQNTEFKGSNGDPVKLFEIENKSPWKSYFNIIDKKASNNLSVIPLTGKLCSLAHHTDFIIVARNQKPYTLLSVKK